MLTIQGITLYKLADSGFFPPVRSLSQEWACLKHKAFCAAQRDPIRLDRLTHVMLYLGAVFLIIGLFPYSDTAYWTILIISSGFDILGFTVMLWAVWANIEWVLPFCLIIRKLHRLLGEIRGGRIHDLPTGTTNRKKYLEETQDMATREVLFKENQWGRVSKEAQKARDTLQEFVKVANALVSDFEPYRDSFKRSEAACPELFPHKPQEAESAAT